jgi:hypothetical protein
MVAQARSLDPEGEYHVVAEGDLSVLGERTFNLILAAFTFDNIPTREQKVALFTAIRERLRPDGVIINLVSSPEIYLHEWASFSTKDFPENKNAKTGDTVKIIITDIDDARPVEDTVWSEQAYHEVYAAAGLSANHTHHPLGRPDEPFEWVNEARIPPWTIYALQRM